MATDINEFRLGKAKEYGADAVFKADEYHPDKIRKMNNGMLAELVIVCAGAEAAVQQAFQSVDRGGTILIFAPTTPDVKPPLPIWDFWRDCVTITNSYAAGSEDIKNAINYLQSGSVTVEDMITHRLSLAETQKGFELTANAGESLKVIIEPQK